jgi:RNA polymerase sigma-54 factor
LELCLQGEIRQIMGQQMYQSLSFLQMSAEELSDYLQELSMENPLLESLPPKRPIESRTISMRAGTARRYNGELLDLPIPDRCAQSLTDALLDQLLTMGLSPKLEAALQHLIINLDERGYLIPGTDRTSIWTKTPELFEKALVVLRSMDPPGVGAENLSDCLCLQLERMGLENSPAYMICKDCLEHLARNHIHHIAHKLSITEQEVVDAQNLIRSLDPIPSNGFDDGRQSVAIIPDIVLEFEEGEPVFYTGDDCLPSYQVSPVYSQMALREDLSEEERSYFREKIEQAKWAVSCVNRRRETLLRCAEEIVNEQWDFFTNQEGTVHPLSMGETAARLGVHLSTISRTVKNKYISCRKGTFPFSYFFAAEVGGDTPEEICRALKRIIAREDRCHPLSDSKICDALRADGYDIARRTVAKYREKENIPPATGRRERAAG